MALRQKQRPIRFGPAEALVVSCLLLLFALALPWDRARFPARQTAAVPAILDGIAWKQSEGAAYRSLRVVYHYEVNGIRYEGVAQDAALQRTLYLAIPDKVLKALQERGVLGMKDIPTPVAEVLRKKGVHRLDRVPAYFIGHVWNQGYRKFADIPRAWLQSARARDYEFVARKLDQLLPDPSHAIATGTTTKSSGISGILSRSLSRADAGEVSPLVVRVNPSAPSDHALDSWGVPTFAWRIPLLLLVALVTLLYVVWGYPKLKRHTPEGAPALVLRLN